MSQRQRSEVTGDRRREPATLLAAAREIMPWMVEIRRDLHRHPELGLAEHRTASRIQSWLDELGIDHVDGLGGTGVLGMIRGAEPGRTVALRADIDALPLQEANELPYASTIPGRMHACGHDVHTAILFGAARLLAERAGELAGTVKLIFQPAEETVGGAKLLIEAGVLDDPQVDAVFGLHVEPTLEVGRIGVRYGQRNAASDNLKIIVHGRSGHAAYPADSVDAIVAAAHVVTALQTVVGRNVDARDSAVVTLGTVQGGAQSNIVAGRVELTGTVRTLAPDVRERVLQRVREVAAGVATGLGARAEVVIDPSYDPLINHDAMVDVVRENATALLGEKQVSVLDRPSMGVEDFGYYLTRAPGAFYSLGVRNEDRGIVHPLHHEQFDVDEESLVIGAAMQTLNTFSVV